MIYRKWISGRGQHFRVLSTYSVPRYDLREIRSLSGYTQYASGVRASRKAVSVCQRAFKWLQCAEV